MDAHSLLLMAGMVICFGIATFVLAERIGIPSIVLLLLVGVLVGPEVFGLVDPSALGVGLRVLIPLFVAIIVFEGGLVLDINDLRRLSYPLQMLMSVGALVTWGSATLVAHFVAGLSWPLATLFGALMSVTGPTVITPLMRRSNAKERLKVLLQAEGVLVDAVGAILAVVVLDVLLTSGTTISGAFDWAERLLLGSLIGLVGGIGLAYALRFIGSKLNAETTRLSALGGAIAIFIIAEAISHEAGIAAAAVSGIVVGNIDFPHEEEVVLFKGDLTMLAITIIFILLAARLKFADLAALGWWGVLAVVLMIVVVRPLCVFASTLGSTLTWRERAFIAAVCPRGVVAASVATFAAISLEEAGFAGGNLLIGLVFMTVIGTVVLQSFTTPLFARLLGVEPMTTLVIGANDLGQLFARQLHSQHHDVVVIDTDQQLIDRVRQHGISTITGDATDLQVLRKAGVERAKAVVALTPSDKLNLLVSQVVRSHFKVATIVARAENESTSSVLRDLGIMVLNPLQASIDALTQLVQGPSAMSMLLSHQADQSIYEVEVSNPRVVGKPLKQLNLPSNVLIVAIRRAGNLFVPDGQTELQAADQLTLIGTASTIQQADQQLREGASEAMYHA